MPSPPMIRARGLTRRFGRRTAVDGLHVDVPRGQVMGLLGVNGAGKSTTLRMLAGALAATEGEATIDGHDVFEAPIEVKRRVGYLPEVPPLYDDMGVLEHVAFAATLHDVPKPRDAARQALARAGVADVADRVVGNLSKGYRQRVGLAAALVHRPKVLLLDEPASGLDPAQRVAMRQLVRELADGEVTVVLSTHVLSEIEAICDAVLVLHEGRAVASDTLENFARSRDLQLVVRTPAGLADALRPLPGVMEVRQSGAALTVRADRDVRADVARLAAAHDLLSFHTEGGLEAAFLALTGSHP